MKKNELTAMIWTTPITIWLIGFMVSVGYMGPYPDASIGQIILMLFIDFLMWPMIIGASLAKG